MKSQIQTQTFEQTDSPEIYSEGFISLNLISGSYTIQPIVTDLNSNREFILKSEDLDIHSKVRLLPLIVESKKSTCNGKETFELTNFEGNIPFSPASYDLIIPVKDIGTESIDVAVISDKDTIVSKKITKSFISSIGFEECSDKIVISNSNKIKTRNFILSGFSRKLREGPFTIIVNKDKKNEFHTLVFWYNKPMSLRNPEIAIKSLKHLANESVVDSLLDYDDEIQYEELVKFWKKKDPTPETEYNELMAEYYNRVDYAQMNFSSLTGIRGVDTDRGMIFIKFGKPDQVDRTSNENGKIVETWLYKKNQRKFVFIDRQGVGEFSLKSS